MILSRGVKTALPEKWTTHKYHGVFLLAMLGASEDRMAEEIGIGIAAFRNMRDNDPDFREAIFNGKTKSSMEVVNGLYQNCIDRYVDEEQVHVVNKKVVIVKVKKFYKGNPYAQVKWLSLKERGQWAESHPPDTTNNITNILYNVQKLSVDDLAMLERLQNTIQITQDAGTTEFNGT